MVRYIDVKNITKWVTETGIEPIISQLINYLEDDYRRWETFDKSPRAASHSTLGVIELMPISDGQTYTFKYVNGHPANTKKNLQTITAFGVLAEVETGYPKLLTEMTVLTALRTAATSAMVAKQLAPTKATTMALIGTGAQAEFQALGFRSALDINKLRVWDTDPAAIKKFKQNADLLGFETEVTTSAAEAVTGADIITTCTADKTYATILTSEMVGPGVHINAIGGDCPGKTELDAALLKKGDIFVEYTEQTRIEGDIQQLEADAPVTEFWSVLTGAAPGRTSKDQITIFDGVGFAIEDFSALRYLQDSIHGTPFYEELDLIAEPANPKNLFSLVQGTSSTQQL